jgi:hypothetical protein
MSFWIIQRLEAENKELKETIKDLEALISQERIDWKTQEEQFNSKIKNLKQAIGALNGYIGKTNVELIQEFDDERKSLLNVIRIQKEFIQQNVKLKKKRAMLFLNWLINKAKEKRYVLLDSYEAWQILKEDSDCIGLINPENPGKAVIDAFKMVEKIAINEGLPIEMKKIFDGKMWGLKYTPEKNKEPAQGVLKSLSEKLKKGIKSKFKRQKEPHPDFRFHNLPEEPDLSDREFFEEYGRNRNNYSG